MRWRTNLAVAFCVALIMGLLALAGHLTLSYAVEIAPYSTEITQDADDITYEISTAWEGAKTNSYFETTNIF